MVLSGCGTHQTAIPFPDLPVTLLATPPDIADMTLKDKPKLSDIEAQHVQEVTTAALVRQQLLDLQQWVRDEKAKYDEAAKKM
jgi:hypothetical protein